MLSTLKYIILLTILAVAELAGILYIKQEVTAPGVLWITLIGILLIITVKNLIGEARKKSPEHKTTYTLIPICIAGILIFLILVRLFFGNIR